MLIFLLAILIGLILVVCGDKGAKSIVTTVINFILLITGLFLIYQGVNPLLVTFVLCILCACVILFYQNEVNQKSKVSMLSVLCVFLILLPFVYFIASGSGSEGFSREQYEITDTNGYDRNIEMNMLYLQISVMMIALIGTLVDAVVAVTATVYEIHDATPNISKTNLIKSAFCVGTSILNTSMHTIFYIYIAEYMTLMLQYVQDFTFVDIINSKSFSQEFLTITVSGLGICLAIPIATMLSIYFATKQSSKNCD